MTTTDASFNDIYDTLDEMLNGSSFGYDISLHKHPIWTGQHVQCL
jgi:hypothetical protein